MGQQKTKAKETVVEFDDFLGNAFYSISKVKDKPRTRLLLKNLCEKLAGNEVYVIIGLLDSDILMGLYSGCIDEEGFVIILSACIVLAIKIYGDDEKYYTKTYHDRVNPYFPIDMLLMTERCIFIDLGYELFLEEEEFLSFVKRFN